MATISARISFKASWTCLIALCTSRASRADGATSFAGNGLICMASGLLRAASVVGVEIVTRLLVADLRNWTGLVGDGLQIGGLGLLDVRLCCRLGKC